MVELCCPVRRCGRANRGRSRAVSRPAKDAAVIVTAEDEGGIVGVDAIVSATVDREVRPVRSIERSRVGSIRRKPCFRL